MFKRIVFLTIYVLKFKVIVEYQQNEYLIYEYFFKIAKKRITCDRLR